MKKGFYVILTTMFVMLVLLLGSFSYGATAKGESPKAKVASVKEPQYGGTLTYARDTNPMTWDIYDWHPYHAFNTSYYMEHLLVGDPQKGPRGTKQCDFTDGANLPEECTRGELAERWEVKKNPLQLIFYLRKGVMWQEKPGVMKAREFVADDVIYAINRLKGSKKMFPGRLDFIGKMETPDKHTLIINLTEWLVQWPYVLGWGYFDGIQAPEQEKAPGGPSKWENACGTGPFMITDFKDGHSFSYTKNPNYWNSEVINGKKYKLPFVDKVYALIIKDEATQIASFRTGKLDLLYFLDWKYVSELKKSLPRVKWARSLYTNNFSLALRMDKKPFNDIRVRRALNMAINRKDMIDHFFGGNAEMHTYPFPPTFREVYTPIDKLSPAAKEVYSYNPEKAKKLLAEAGYPNGFTFKAQVPNNVQVRLDLAQMVAAYLDKIGVKLILEPMDYGPFLSLMNKKNHEEAIFFATDQGGPYSGIQKNFMTGMAWNPHAMSDPYLDKAWTDAAENPNLTTKQSLEVMKKLAVYAIEQAPAIIIPTYYVYTAWWPWVQNYYGELYAGCGRRSVWHSRLWIDHEMKKKMGYE